MAHAYFKISKLSVEREEAEEQLSEVLEVINDWILDEGLCFFFFGVTINEIPNMALTLLIITLMFFLQEVSRASEVLRYRHPLRKHLEVIIKKVCWVSYFS